VGFALKGRPVPAWVLAAAGLGLIAVVALLWRNTTSTPTAGKDIKVRPGMYDMRAEMAKQKDNR